jgi:hypothetical protein
LTTGQRVTDFVIENEGAVGERFTATLTHETKTLRVGWTEDPGTTVFRIGEAQRLAGGPGSFTTITGSAVPGENLHALIKAGRFNEGRVADILSRRLGGKWKVETSPNPNGSIEIIATQIGK